MKSIAEFDGIVAKFERRLKRYYIGLFLMVLALVIKIVSMSISGENGALIEGAISLFAIIFIIHTLIIAEGWRKGGSPYNY